MILDRFPFVSSLSILQPSLSSFVKNRSVLIDRLNTSTAEIPSTTATAFMYSIRSSGKATVIFFINNYHQQLDISLTMAEKVLYVMVGKGNVLARYRLEFNYSKNSKSEANYAKVVAALVKIINSNAAKVDGKSL